MTHRSPLGRARLLVALIAAGAALVGCSTGDGREPAPGARDRPAFDTGHVHAVDVDPTDGTVYVGAHRGLFRLDGNALTRVGDTARDTMALTVRDDGSLLSSGHPGPGEDGLPPVLGLQRSDDAGRTWTSVSLEGTADLHTIDSTPDRLWAVDSMAQTLVTSTDGQDWQAVVRGDVLDVAAGTGDPATVLAVTGDLRLVELGLDGGQRPVESPPLVLVDAVEPGVSDRLVGIGPDSTVQVRTDGTWTQAGRVPGAVQALTATPDAWYVATDRGLHRSTDDGKTWQRVSR